MIIKKNTGNICITGEYDYVLQRCKLPMMENTSCGSNKVTIFTNYFKGIEQDYFNDNFFERQTITSKCYQHKQFSSILQAQELRTYSGQIQSPFFISDSSGPTLLGPSSLHVRHRRFLAKFTKLQLQRKQKDIIQVCNSCSLQ